MFRLFSAVLLCTCQVWGQSQAIGWHDVLQKAASSDPKLVDSARVEITREILPRLINEDATLAAADLEDGIQFFGDSNAAVRQQVSALLVVIAMFRSDSASVLAPAVGKLIEHASDPVARIRTNSIGTLGALRPEIPLQAFTFLRETARQPDGELASAAGLALARASSSDARATNALRSMLQDARPRTKLLAIRAVDDARAVDPNLLAVLGDLISSTDFPIASAALNAISDCGAPAMKENYKQLEALSSVTNSELAVRARKLLNAYHPQ